MNTPVNIPNLHEAIKSAIRAQYPDLATVDYYPRPGERIPTPAVFLEIDSIPVESPGDTGTEQLPVRIEWNAYVVLSYKAGNKLACRSLAASLMAFLRGKQFGQAISPIEVQDAVPDLLDVGLNQAKADEYEVMRVDFHHSALLGDDVWAYDGEVPTEVIANGETIVP